MSHFLLWYIVIRLTLMYIIHFNFHYSDQCRDTHYPLFLCLEMEQDQEDKNSRCNQQKTHPNNPCYRSSSCTDNNSAKNDDLFGY